MAIYLVSLLPPSVPKSHIENNRLMLDELHIVYAVKRVEACMRLSLIYYFIKEMQQLANDLDITLMSLFKMSESSSSF